MPPYGSPQHCILQYKLFGCAHFRTGYQFVIFHMSIIKHFQYVYIILFYYLAGRPDYAQYLIIPYVRGAGEITVFLSAMIGASVAFLWFNANPAEIFMGDTGSLALGGLLGTIALFLKQEILLIIIGGIFVLEALSVILQVGSYRLRNGKRIFLMAPYHHHLQKRGLAEPKIIARFWIVAAILALVGLTTLKLR